MRVSILLWNIHSFKSLRRRHPSAHLIVQDRFSFCPRGFSRSWLWCSDDLFLKDFSAAAASCQRTKTDVLNASFRLTRNRLQQHFKFFHLFLMQLVTLFMFYYRHAACPWSSSPSSGWSSSPPSATWFATTGDWKSLSVTSKRSTTWTRKRKVLTICTKIKNKLPFGVGRQRQHSLLRLGYSFAKGNSYYYHGTTSKSCQIRD